MYTPDTRDAIIGVANLATFGLNLLHMRILGKKASVDMETDYHNSTAAGHQPDVTAEEFDEIMERDAKASRKKFERTRNVARFQDTLSKATHVASATVLASRVIVDESSPEASDKLGDAGVVLAVGTMAYTGACALAAKIGQMKSKAKCEKAYEKAEAASDKYLEALFDEYEEDDDPDEYEDSQEGIEDGVQGGGDGGFHPAPAVEYTFGEDDASVEQRAAQHDQDSDTPIDQLPDGTPAMSIHELDRPLFGEEGRKREEDEERKRREEEEKRAREQREREEEDRKRMRDRQPPDHGIFRGRGR